MSNLHEEINALRQKKREVEVQLSDVTKDLLKALFNQFIQKHAIDFKENGLPLPHYVRISFEDEYDDEGGYDKQINQVVFYDKERRLIRTDFTVEMEGYSYDEEFTYAVQVIITDEFDLDYLANLLGEEFQLQLR